MKRKKNQAKQYFSTYWILAFSFGIVFFFFEKGQLELWINSLHNLIFDRFFTLITFLGDGALLVPVILLLSLYRFSFSIFMLWNALIHTLLVILGKRLIFKGTPRPAEYLKDVDFYQIPGIELHHWNSFPSGHTATAFAMTCGLAIIFSKNKTLQLIFLGIGCLIGFSRVYLMQHFFWDVWAGSVVGVVSALVAREITLRYFSSKAFRKSIFKKPKPRIAKLRRQLISRQNVA
jgi:membrane-associated phospholipid phosphatase